MCCLVLSKERGGWVETKCFLGSCSDHGFPSWNCNSPLVATAPSFVQKMSRAMCFKCAKYTVSAFEVDLLRAV